MHLGGAGWAQERFLSGRMMRRPSGILQAAGRAAERRKSGRVPGGILPGEQRSGQQHGLVQSGTAEAAELTEKR